MDLIERQKAIDVCNRVIDVFAGHFGAGVLVAVRDEISDLPSAQPERKKGKWITKSTGGEMFDCCTVCGYVEWDDPKNFCPNCGAEMEGQDDSI